MRWKIEAAQSMLDLRAIYLNGELDEFQENRIQENKRKFYPHREMILKRWNVAVYSAAGELHLIDMTERVIKRLKYIWLNRVAIVKGFDHLESLCNSFSEWYNEWHTHYRFEGRTPN